MAGLQHKLLCTQTQDMGLTLLKSPGGCAAAEHLCHLLAGLLLHSGAGSFWLVDANRLEQHRESNKLVIVPGFCLGSCFTDAVGQASPTDGRWSGLPAQFGTDGEA